MMPRRPPLFATRPAPVPRHQAARPVPWVGSDGRLRLIPPELIPAGMQSVRARVPMRLASCEEVGCTRLTNGWTRAPGGPFTGDRTADVGGIFVEPGLPCPELHKLPTGDPPLYEVNGRWVVESEFIERLHAGVEATTHIQTRGL